LKKGIHGFFSNFAGYIFVFNAGITVRKINQLLTSYVCRQHPGILQPRNLPQQFFAA
jgi:hypothetical protein